MSYGTQDARLKTALIVVKDRQYLSRVEIVTGRVVWDPHLSNAWTTRDRKAAAAVARKLGGTLALFNPIVWEVREL